MRYFGLIALLLVANCTLFSLSPNYTVTYETHYDELAHIHYEQHLNDHGMNYIYVYANPAISLLDQHRGAGFLQGYTTYNEIYNAFKNLQNFKIHGSTVKAKLQGFLENQLEYIENMAQTYPRDIYWQYVGAYLQQCKFAYRGFLQRIHQQARLDMYIGWSQFYYLTSVGDFRQLLPALGGLKDDKQKSCSGYVKLLDGEFYFSHSTMNYYPYMLRVFKTYNFPSREGKVGSQTITFSSRPGDFNSKDDFYILSSGISIMETSLLNYNADNAKDLNPKSVPCWLRVAVASNLARNGKQWIDYFVRQNSGTHSSQWVVVDPSRLNLMTNIAVFVEQAFSLIRITDMSSSLLENGYIASYNVPYDKQVYKKMGYEQYPYDYNNDPRARIFKKYNKIMTNEELMKKWLITNEEEDVREGLAPREDLYTSNPSPYGLIDCKIVSASSLKNNYYWAISSPSTSNGRFPPFTWASFPNMTHDGMPTVFNFPWVKVAIDIEKSRIDAAETTLHHKANQEIQIQ